MEGLQQLKEEMMAQFERFAQRFEGMEQRLRDGLMDDIKSIGDRLSAIEKKLDAEKEQSAEEKERKRSVVFIGLAEQKEGKPSERVKADIALVTDVLDELGVDAPFTAFRMGKPNPDRANKGRLLKVIFPASVFLGICLTRWKDNRDRMRRQTHWRNLIIRPSLTKEELDADREKRRKKWLEHHGEDEENGHNVTRRRFKHKGN